MSVSSRRNFLKNLPQSSVSLPLVGRLRRAAARAAAPRLPQADDPEFWDRVRDQFLLARDKTYFNAGTVGALPRPVFEAVVDDLRRRATDIADWDLQGEPWIGGYDPETRLRGRIAALLGADVPEIALAENVTMGMNEVAAGLDLAAGDEVLLSDQEHPGSRCPWEARAERLGIALRRVRHPRPIRDAAQVLELYAAAFTPRTRVLVIPHMVTSSGAILPVRELCAEARSRGVFSVVDGAHAIGQIPVDLHGLGCDAYAGCFHKWFLAPAGTGFLYVRRDRAGEIRTTLASERWDDRDDPGFRLGQRGTTNVSLLRGLEAAIDFHEALGPGRIYGRIKELGDRLRAGLRAVPGILVDSPEDPAMCAGVTVWTIEGWTGDGLMRELWTRGRLRPRSSDHDFRGVRQSTHVFNSPAEIDRTVEIAREMARGPRP